MIGNIHCLKGDRDSLFFQDWEPWLTRVANLNAQYVKMYEDCIFHLHEQVAVSLFVHAAATTGYLALAEYPVIRGKAEGRADLWMTCNNHDYWFEFKRSDYSPANSSWGLAPAFAHAMKQSKGLNVDEGNVVISALIAATREDRFKDAGPYDRFCDEADYAFRFGRDDHSGVWLYFKIREI